MCATANSCPSLYTKAFDLNSRKVWIKTWTSWHWERLLRSWFCSTSSSRLQSPMWMTLWINIRVSAHQDDFQYQRSSHTSWEPDRQCYPGACSAELAEKSVDLAPQVPLSVVHQISCSLHFVPKTERRGKTVQTSHHEKAFHLWPTKDSSEQSHESFSSSKLCICYLFWRQNMAVKHGVSFLNPPPRSLNDDIYSQKRTAGTAHNCSHIAWTNNTLYSRGL